VKEVAGQVEQLTLTSERLVVLEGSPEVPPIVILSGDVKDIPEFFKRAVDG
jgi:hypothetical protein